MEEEKQYKPFVFDKMKQDGDKTAVAIEYVPSDAAPRIIASGKGKVAERIIEKAKEKVSATFRFSHNVSFNVSSSFYIPVFFAIVFLNRILSFRMIQIKSENDHCCYYHKEYQHLQGSRCVRQLQLRLHNRVLRVYPYALHRII